MILRLANADDASALASLARLTYYENYAAHPLNTPADEIALRTYVEQNFTSLAMSYDLRDDRQKIWVVQIDEALVAYIKLVGDNMPIALQGNRGANVDKVYVSRAYQGLGLGKQLMQTALQYAHTQKDWDLLWLCVWDINTKAIQFYERFGFVVSGSVPFKMGREVYLDTLMVKPLSNTSSHQTDSI